MPPDPEPPCAGLVVFDLDGTLLRGRTVCEVIADSLGRGKRMREMEMLTGREAIACARREMAGWYANERREDLLACLAGAEAAAGAAEGIALLKAHGHAVAIASITWEFAVRDFARRWGIADVLGTGLADHCSVTDVWPEDKAAFMQRLIRRHHLDRSQAHAVGDSGGDIPMLRTAGHAWFVGRIAPPGIDGLRHCPHSCIDRIAQEIVLGTGNAA